MQQLLSEEFRQKLERLARENAQTYQTAEPFPHIVIDDFLPPEILREVLKNFPDPNAVRWTRRDDLEEVKLEFTKAEMLPAPVREVLYFFNSPIILKFLEELSGVEDLLPDPYFVGGGLHQIQPGGYLDVHADFNKYEKFDLDRRLNLLVYLNENWQEEYGGHLELWDTSMTECVKRVLPVFNRCVVFSTTSDSYHGHPLPLACPKDRTRKSMALYYYTNGRPAEEANESHSTLFQKRPGKEVAVSARALRTTKRVVRSLLPPIITDAYYRVTTKQK